MKWTILIGILGLAIGFCIGRLGGGSSGAEEKAVDVIEKSDRRLGAAVGDRRLRSQRPGGRIGAHNPVEEILRTGEVGTISGSARLMKWILELESGDFPEVLEKLEGIKAQDGLTDDPFAGDSLGSELVLLALSRWYELDGEEVLDWVVEKNEAHNARKKITSLIKDGYARDPAGGLRALEKHVRLLTDENGLSSAWFFEVARWSTDLKSDLGRLEKLFAKHGLHNPSPDDPFAPSPDDPFAVAESPEGYLARGAIAAGRADELRTVLGGQNPEVLRELERREQQGLIDNATREGWQALREGVDQGKFEAQFWMAERVFEEWSKEDPDGAADWFLKQDVGDRGDQIARVLGLTRSGWSNGAADSLEFHPVAVAERIQQFESRGEPVEEAWNTLISKTVGGDHWDEVEALKSRVPAKVWEEMSSRMVGEAIDSNSLSLGGEGRLWFQNIDHDELAVLERFGLKERALRQIAEGNEESLRELQRRLGLE